MCDSFLDGTISSELSSDSSCWTEVDKSIDNGFIQFQNEVNQSLMSSENEGSENEYTECSIKDSAELTNDERKNTRVKYFSDDTKFCSLKSDSSLLECPRNENFINEKECTNLISDTLKKNISFLSKGVEMEGLKKNRTHTMSSGDSEPESNISETNDQFASEVENPINSDVITQGGQSVNEGVNTPELGSLIDDANSASVINQAETTRISRNEESFTTPILHLDPKDFEVDISKPVLYYEDITSDDEVWLIQCPKTIDPNRLHHRKFSVQAPSIVTLRSGGDVEVKPLDARGTKITCILPSTNEETPFKTVPFDVAGQLTITEIVDVPDIQIPDIKRVNVPFPSNLKHRHPFFGADYKTELNERLNVISKWSDMPERKTGTTVDQDDFTKNEKLLNKDTFRFQGNLSPSSRSEVLDQKRRAKKRKRDVEDSIGGQNDTSGIEFKVPAINDLSAPDSSSFCSFDNSQDDSNKLKKKKKKKKKHKSEQNSDSEDTKSPVPKKKKFDQSAESFSLSETTDGSYAEFGNQAHQKKKKKKNKHKDSSHQDVSISDSISFKFSSVSEQDDVGIGKELESKKKQKKHKHKTDDLYNVDDVKSEPSSTDLSQDMHLKKHKDKSKRSTPLTEDTESIIEKNVKKKKRKLYKMKYTSLDEGC